MGIFQVVLVEPDHVGSAYPGEVITFEQAVINTSTGPQTYRVTPSSGAQHASAVLLDSDTFSPTNAITVSLAANGQPGYTTTVYLEVTILDTATAGDIANPSVIASNTEIESTGANDIQIEILPINGTRYVATLTDGGADNTNCTDPLRPCATIQHAIEQALPGDEILVAAGVYFDFSVEVVGADSLHQNVFIDKPVTIRGGYDVGDGFTVQQPITNTTIIDAQNERRGIYVAPGITATLQGLQIHNGNASPLATIVNGSTRNYGGGIYNVGSNLTITSTWVFTSIARFGGGIYHADGELLLNNSVLAYNTNENAQGNPDAGGAWFVHFQYCCGFREQHVCGEMHHIPVMMVAALAKEMLSINTTVK